MQISLINFTRVPDGDVQRVARAINRQLGEDFRRHWHIDAALRLEGRVDTTPSLDTRLTPAELRGDAILYLYDGPPDVANALGYHNAQAAGVPYGFVFTEISRELGEPWSVTLSHETLELVADAQVNMLARGPHPSVRGRQVFHWFEMCDAVQADRYEIDGVHVSNFVLPLYFTANAEPGGRNDFLGSGLQSFGVNPGGYIGFFDPLTGKNETFAQAADAFAARRLEVKQPARHAGRSARRQAEGPLHTPARMQTRKHSGANLVPSRKPAQHSG